ncbi:site-2 protease family protein [Streptomyces sp. Amel2xC10]|uniref:site-2 protease family protein n=1 Tax=Streptomyces sp. Amel2xC10 TaxID=1305826 RepID=UPI000A08F1DB|nr:site-2 protease family protein [Streptomyces sp. Amel2xC10]SMF23139.1 Zn-dependent protease (includes SpoIVFB) [Streptomyces sp. Amel2xC10]
MVESGANERPRPDDTDPAEPHPATPTPRAEPAAEPPTETSPDSSAEPSAETPSAAPVGSPTETSADSSAEPSAETPSAAPVGSPTETSADSSAEPSAETPSAAPVGSPTETSADSSAEPSAETPSAAPVGPSTETPADTSAGPSAEASPEPPPGPRSEATADRRPEDLETTAGPPAAPRSEASADQHPEHRETPAAPTAPAPDHTRAHADTHHATPGAPGTPETPTGPHHEPPAPVPNAQDAGRRPRGKGRPPRRPPEQPRGGLLMGRPFGVPVYVAPSWFLVAALITWVFGGQLDRVLPELGAARYLVSLFFAVAFYASVLIHELAHTVAALRFKLPVRRIQLQFFGGVSEIEKEAETPGREFWLAFVGPLLSLALAGVFYLAMQPVEPGTVPGVLLAGLMISNLIVAVFNLLPGLPLDGGRMLRAVVWKITGKPMSGTVAAAWVGRALAVSVLIGLPLLTQSGALGAGAEDSVGMDTVTDALLAAILAAIIWTGAGNSLRMARLREHLPELRARTLTRRAVPVETHTPLSEALRRANDAGARALVVVDAHGEPLSLVREAAIVGVPEHRRPWVAVSGLAQDLTDGMRVSAELAGEDLLDVLRATPATEYLVVEETGEIYGVLSAADVERAFVKAMARPN